MTAAVETMAWTGQVPWHGLGEEVSGDLSPEEMLRAARLNWTVSKRQITFPGKNGETLQAEGQYVLARDTDDACYGPVGERWRPVQNKTAFEFFNAYVTAGGATMETAGSLRGGELVWGLARLGSDFTLRGGDEVRGYLLLINPHRGGRSIIARTTTVRVVCQNTLNLSLQEEAKFEARFSHNREFEPEEAVETLGIAREAVVEFARNARLLKKLRMSDEEVVRVLAPVYQPADAEAAIESVGEIANPSLRSVLQAYRMAPGADVGTGWGVLNAATFHADHEAGRDDDRDRRLQSAWLGTEAKRKQRVLAGLLELAG